MPEMCTMKGVKLLIVDRYPIHKSDFKSLRLMILMIQLFHSIAGLVRFDYKTTSAIEMNSRTQTLFKIANRLKWLSDIFHIYVIVVNQVSSRY